MAKWLDWAMLIAYCGLIFWLSNQPSLPVPPLFEHQDKVMHAGAYFVMAILTWRLLRHLRLNGKPTVLLTVAFCSLYGVSDEWHQTFVPGRDAGADDWLADTFGAFVAAMLLNRFRNRFF